MGIKDLIKKIPPRMVERVHFYKCIDCHIIILASPGDTSEIGSDRWDLCERCRNKRNGFRGALHNREMGVV